MFGHHKQARKEKKLRKERESFEAERKRHEAGAPEREKQQRKEQNAEAEERAAAKKEKRKQAYKEGNLEAEELYKNPNITGLDPEKRAALQYEANQGIDREMQAANRNVLGQQGQRGISAKSGIGYAQRRDLQNAGSAAKGAAERNLINLNENLRMKKIANAIALGRGEANQQQLDEQTALDELKLEEERRENKFFRDQYNKQFNRI